MFTWILIAALLIYLVGAVALFVHLAIMREEPFQESWTVLIATSALWVFVVPAVAWVFYNLYQEAKASS